MIKRCYVLLFFLFVWLNNLDSMVFDNRFFPLYLKPFTKQPFPLAHFFIQPFVMHADKAQSDLEEIAIPAIDGKYNLIDISNGLQKIGILSDNPLRSDLQGITTINFNREGKLDSQGIAFYFEYPINTCISIGADFLFMHISSRHEFCLDSSCINVGIGDRNYLHGLKERLNQSLSVLPPLYCKTVFGDFDFFARFSYMWLYTFKFRSIDLGLKLGMIAPTSSQLSINNPAAVPAGQNHWGVYVELENQYELKEDLFARVMFRASKRFKRTFLSRMPVNFEPLQYGSVIGPLENLPGWTFVFNPSFTAEDIREGLGVTVLYTLVGHLKDNLSDKRTDKSIPVNLEPVILRSSWTMEHVTLGAFYDFAKFKECSRILPKISVYWDIPVSFLAGKRFVKTHGISVLFDAAF